MPAKKATAAKEKEKYYEVEEILQARLSSKKDRKLHWDYNVKWKGYTAKDNTWESEESCKGAPDCVRTFWRKADLKGRNHRNVKDFNKDDVVGLLPKGKKPPAKLPAKAKAKLKELEATPKKSASTTSRSAKGRRASTTSASTKAKGPRASPRKRRRASARV
ncbi:hypothetical protein SCHPADRAFT_911714 [Schizopora paradoxa]|uniref:Chromo domain-containing protein n=1 Tax=Schizopora paradoxa TaxID=27342 RepID=A0A0H2RHE0_9AGAM|nr:hypothetical protein SCHPADRAFT_911714 [Schizopora paradoxa]